MAKKVDIARAEVFFAKRAAKAAATIAGSDEKQIPVGSSTVEKTSPPWADPIAHLRPGSLPADPKGSAALAAAGGALKVAEGMRRGATSPGSYRREDGVQMIELSPGRFVSAAALATIKGPLP